MPSHGRSIASDKGTCRQSRPGQSTATPLLLLAPGHPRPVKYPARAEVSPANSAVNLMNATISSVTHWPRFRSRAAGITTATCRRSRSNSAETSPSRTTLAFDMPSWRHRRCPGMITDIFGWASEAACIVSSLRSGSAEHERGALVIAQTGRITVGRAAISAYSSRKLRTLTVFRLCTIRAGRMCKMGEICSEPTPFPPSLSLIPVRCEAGWKTTMVSRGVRKRVVGDP